MNKAYLCICLVLPLLTFDRCQNFPTPWVGIVESQVEGLSHPSPHGANHATSLHLPLKLAHSSQPTGGGQKSQLEKRSWRGKSAGTLTAVFQFGRKSGTHAFPQQEQASQRVGLTLPLLSNLRRSPIHLAWKSFPIVNTPWDITVSLETLGRKESVILL